MTVLQQLIRRRLAVAVLIAVAVAIPSWWFLWMSPQGHKLVSVRAQQVQSASIRSSLLLQLHGLETEKKHVRSFERYLAHFGAAIPSTPDAPGLVVQVYDLAKHDDVQLSGITDDSEVSKGSYSTIPVSIEVSGGHDHVVAFVDGLYKIKRLLTIEALNLSGTADVNRSSDAGITASISATAYTLAVTGPSGPRA